MVHKRNVPLDILDARDVYRAVGLACALAIVASPVLSSAGKRGPQNARHCRAAEQTNIREYSGKTVDVAVGHLRKMNWFSPRRLETIKRTLLSLASISLPHKTQDTETDWVLSASRIAELTRLRELKAGDGGTKSLTHVPRHEGRIPRHAKKNSDKVEITRQTLSRVLTVMTCLAKALEPQKAQETSTQYDERTLKYGRSAQRVYGTLPWLSNGKQQDNSVGLLKAKDRAELADEVFQLPNALDPQNPLQMSGVRNDLYALVGQLHEQFIGLRQPLTNSRSFGLD